MSSQGPNTPRHPPQKTDRATEHKSAEDLFLFILYLEMQMNVLRPPAPTCPSQWKVPVMVLKLSKLTGPAKDFSVVLPAHRSAAGKM